MGKVPKKSVNWCAVVLFGMAAGLLVSAGMLLIFYLKPQSAVIKCAADMTMPADPLVNKVYEYQPPRYDISEEEPISYEMQLDMQKVSDHHSVNPEVAGWIYIPDTPIDYPIVQTGDNDKYLHRNWRGEDSFAGSIFADYKCVLENSENSLLYGHNMANGSMFASLRRFRDTEWAAEHMYFEVATLTKRYLYRVVSVNVLYGMNGADFRYWDCTNLGKKDYEAFAQNVRDTSEVWYGWSEDPEKIPPYGTRLITLQTCVSGSDDGMRFIVFGECMGER